MLAASEMALAVFASSKPMRRLTVAVGGDLPREAGRAEAAGELEMQGPAQCAHRLRIRRWRPRRSFDHQRASLRQREQRRQDDDAQMADAAVCMSSRTRPCPATLLAKTASAAGATMSVPTIEQGPAPAVASAAACRDQGSEDDFERAGKKIEQAGPELGARLGGKMVVALCDDACCEPYGQRTVLSCASTCAAELGMEASLS